MVLSARNPDHDLVHADRLYRQGQLSAAKAVLAETVTEALTRMPGESHDPRSFDVVAFSIRVDLALGRTMSAQNSYVFLNNWDEWMATQFQKVRRTDARQRSVLFPRQDGRMFLAATGRLGQALAAVDLEVASSNRRTLWGVLPSHCRLDLAIRAARGREIIACGTEWMRVRGRTSRSPSDTRGDDHSSSSVACDGQVAETVMMLAAVQVALAQGHPFREALLFRARRRVRDSLARLNKEDEALLILRGEYLSGQIAALGRRADAMRILEAGRCDAAAYGHRDMEGQFAVALAKLSLDEGNFTTARSLAADAVGLARSQDGGRPLQPTLDSAFSIGLEADKHIIRSYSAPQVDQAAPRPETIILVHGTFAAPTAAAERQWFERGSHFCLELNKQLVAHNSTAKCWAHLPDEQREFFWSGLNNWIDRSEAAVSLASHLRKLMPKWRCHLVAHSHGGNVCHQALRILEKGNGSWDGRLVTLGTPFFHSADRRSRVSSLAFVLPLAVIGLAINVGMTVWIALIAGAAVAVLSRLMLRSSVYSDDRELDNYGPIWFGNDLGPRTLAISSDQDEALKIMQLALESEEAPQARSSATLWMLAKTAWVESDRVGKAQKRSLSFLPVRFLVELTGLATSPFLLRKAWRMGRERITGLSGFGIGLESLRARPQPAVDGVPTAARFERLPPDVVSAAKRERLQDVAGARDVLQQFLETERWSLTEIDALLESVSIGNLVHSAYYRDEKSIRAIARWLAIPEPPVRADPLMSFATEEVNHPMGAPLEPDLWSDTVETDRYRVVTT